MCVLLCRSSIQWSHFSFFFFFCIAACPIEKRRNFQQRMLEFINKKRAVANPAPEAEPTGPRDPAAEPRLNTPAKVAIYWMFDELDVSPQDRKLSSQELSGFMMEIKCTVAPRACAESLTSYCDYNNDGYVSLSEWCWCSGLDNSKSEGMRFTSSVCTTRMMNWRAQCVASLRTFHSQHQLPWLYRRHCGSENGAVNTLTERLVVWINACTFRSTGSGNETHYEPKHRRIMLAMSTIKTFAGAPFRKFGLEWIFENEVTGITADFEF